MRKKVLSLILSFSMVLGLIPALSAAYAADNAAYAEYVFGDTDSSVNVEGEVDVNHRVIVEKGGKKALQRTTAEEDLYIYMKLDSDLFRNPQGRPVHITVEYFDEGGGCFTLSYDGTHNDYGNGRHSNSKDIVHMQNTGEWKTFDFYIEDITFEHGYYNGYDFRIGLWSEVMGRSLENVYIHSIKVQAVQPSDFLLGEISSLYQGNIFGPGENKELAFDIRNRTSSEFNGTAEYTVRNFDGAEVLRKSEQLSVAPNENKKHYAAFNEIDKFGVYTIEVSYNLEGTVDGEKHVFVESQKGDFSYVNKVPQDIKNEKVNVQTHGTWYGYNEAALASDWLGVGGVRDEIRWRYVEQEKGKLSIPQENDAYVNDIKNNNMDFFMLLAYGNWLYDGGEPSAQMVAPETEEQLDGWERYCGFIAETYKDYFKEFEVWNEYNINGFNNKNASPENYVEMAKRAARAIKEHIPDAKVFGGGLAGADTNYLKRMLDAGLYNYVDGFSCHPYDWSGEFRNQKFIDDMRSFRDTINQYGNDNKPIYMTELGINDGTEADTGVSTIEKASMIIQAYSLMVGENLADKWWWYDLIKSSADKTDQETNFGLIKTAYNAAGETAYAATPAYAVMAGMNYMLADAEVTGSVVYEDSEMRAYRFRSRFGDDIATAWSTMGDRNINLRLGCDEVEVYDMYTNLIGTAKSSSGEYTFTVGNEPVYIKGNFTDFSRIDGETLINSDFQSCADNSVITVDSNVDGWYLKRVDPSADTGTAAVVNENGNKLIKTSGKGVRVERNVGQTYTSGTVSFTYKIKRSGLGTGYAFLNGSNQYYAPSFHGETAKLGKYPPWEDGNFKPAVYADKVSPMTIRPDTWYTITGTIDLDNDKIGMIIQDPWTTARVVNDDYTGSFNTVQFCSGWEGYDMYIDDVVIKYYGSGKTQVTTEVDLPFTETFEGYSDVSDMAYNWNVYSEGGSSINTEMPQIVDDNGNKVFYLGFSKGPDNTCAKALFSGKVTNGTVKAELDIKPSDKMATHIYFNGTRKGGEPGVSAMSMLYFINGKVRAMSNSENNGIELGSFSSDTWYHCTAEVDVSAGTMAVTVDDGRGNVYEASGVYSDLRDMEMLSIEGITLQEWGASENGGSYFDNISVSQSRPLAELPFTDDFGKYERVEDMVSYGWNIYSGYSSARPRPNIASEIVTDSESNKSFKLGLNGVTDTVYAAQNFAEQLTSGSVVAEFDIKPGNMLSTYIWFGAGNSHAAMLYFSGGKIIVGQNRNSDERTIGSYTPGRQYHCKAVMNIDTDTVSVSVTDEDGNIMKADGFTIRDGVKYSYIDSFNFQEWGASENDGSVFDNLVIRKAAKNPSLSLRSLSFVNGETVTSSRDGVPPQTEKILVEFGTEMDVKTLSDIAIKDESGDSVSYTAGTDGTKAVLTLAGLLKPETEYTVSIPESVANTDGVTLGSDRDITFTTGEGDLVGKIVSAKANGSEITQLSQLNDGDTFDVTAEVVNTNGKQKETVLICAFYDDGGALIDVSFESISAAPSQKTEQTVQFEALNIKNAAEMKLMLWDGIASAAPVGNMLKIGK
ncbi:MAG TPA: Ig-like domain-containing protein [Candidatus Ornithomonoglobus intestinigallinarum]|uniref:Ig-like domain-containing protein n=1 Tax=Candidatus Ornithomonoglobus intestinigallinarum TaxID=2840894 RepID=A0A9D1H579_9FIRM|nr:Ig-like domain-containing protein [Candidatus Ornithomonoglobus intestinigallinarum]